MDTSRVDCKHEFVQTLRGLVVCTNCGQTYEQVSGKTSTPAGSRKKGIIAGMVVIVAIAAILAANPMDILLTPADTDIDESIKSIQIEHEITDSAGIVYTTIPIGDKVIGAPFVADMQEDPGATDAQKHGDPVTGTTDAQEQKHEDIPAEQDNAQNGQPQYDVEQLQQIALQQINKDRREHGLEEIMQSDNVAAQIHAQDMFEHGQISHFLSNGEKPYMTYSKAGGTGAILQNFAYESVQCHILDTQCRQINPIKSMEKAQYAMMHDDSHANWGHRDNILDPHHTHVSIGIAYDEEKFAYVQNFENNYIDFKVPISVENNRLKMEGEIIDEYQVSQVIIIREPVSGADTYEKNKNSHSYSYGEPVLRIIKPAGPGYQYSSLPPGTEAGYYWRADTYAARGDSFAIEHNIGHVTDADGIYTFVVTLESYDTRKIIQGASKSFWINT